MIGSTGKPGVSGPQGPPGKTGIMVKHRVAKRSVDLKYNFEPIVCDVGATWN